MFDRLKNKIHILQNIYLKNNEISKGINELKSKYKYQIKFTDTLKCISYKK